MVKPTLDLWISRKKFKLAHFILLWHASGYPKKQSITIKAGNNRLAPLSFEQLRDIKQEDLGMKRPQKLKLYLFCLQYGH